MPTAGAAFAAIGRIDVSLTNLIDKMKKVAVKWGTMEVCPNLKREYETNLSYILAQTELSFLENAPIYEIMDGK